MNERYPINQFELFDVVRVNADTLGSGGQPIAVGTTGTVMEVLDNGAAYLVELLGDWATDDDSTTFFVLAEAEVPDIFRETLGIEVFQIEQLELVKPAAETVGRQARRP